MPINRYRDLIAEKIAEMPIGQPFKLRRLLEEIWNDGDLTRVEKQVLGKQFRAEVETPLFGNVRWIQRDTGNAAYYRRIE